MMDRNRSLLWEYLYPPDKIIQNLISVLIDAAEQNKEKVRQLEFALRFVRTISTENGSSAQH